MKNKWAISAIALIAASFIVLIVLGGQSIFSQNNPVPDITLTTLSGKSLRMSELRGKVVLVNFWATTCTTCVGEMPQMVEAYKTFAPRGYEMVAVAMAYDRPDWVLNFTRQHGLPFAVALDIKGEAEQAFGGVRLTPTSFLIDKQGRIVQRYLGEPDFARLHQKIEALLKQPV